jgi:hypothetical protein
MPTFEIDDQACFNAKVLRAGNEAFGAWCRAGSWSMANLTDGYVTRDVTRIIASDEVWYRLRDCGLPGAGLVEEVEGGWQIHDWSHWQRTSDEIRSHREKQAKRQQNRRALLRAKKPVTRDVPSDNTCDIPRSSHGESRPPNPHPNPHPDLSEGSQATGPTKTEPEELKPDTLSSRPSSRKRSTLRQVPLKISTPKDLTWAIWREMYSNSRRNYGKFVANAAAPKAVETLAERALSEAQAELVDRGTPGDPTPLVEELLRHWFASFLRDDGFNEFLATKRHAIEYLPKSLSEYGLPRGWGEAAKRNARGVLDRIGVLP